VPLNLSFISRVMKQPDFILVSYRDTTDERKNIFTSKIFSEKNLFEMISV